jgi:flagellar basal-body rod protein FlgG
MANVNTTAYKRDHVVSHAFSDEFLYRLNDPGIRMFRHQWPVGTINPGVFVDDVFTAFTQGALQQTGNSLDIAIFGQGFFTVNVDGEELFTRDGAFTLFNGLLMTACGGRVQGQDGDIILPNGYIVIDERGQIFVNDEHIDTIRMTMFTDLHSLRKMQNNFFRTTEHSEITPFGGTLRQGFLEGSNVNIVAEMVQMITLSRAYETNARMVTIQDNTLQHAVNDIARR